MHPLLPGVIELVRQAGEAILPYWRSELVVQQKSDDSPVTAADLAAHRVLADGLPTLAADIPVLSEESCDIPLAQRQAWQRWWLVDPLDGTKEFIAGSDEFTVNVALIEQGRVVFGVVGVPPRKTVYAGGAGLGALRLEADGHCQSIRVREASSEEWVVVASRRHSSPRQDALLETLGQRHSNLRLRNIGSSLKFCLLAEGQADFYPRLAPTSQWDTAAAQGVLEGAGGQVVDLQGHTFSYAARQDYLNPSFLALTGGLEGLEDVLREE